MSRQKLISLINIIFIIYKNFKRFVFVIFLQFVTFATKSVQRAYYIGCKGTKIFTNVQIFIVFFDCFFENSLCKQKKSSTFVVALAIIESKRTESAENPMKSRRIILI